MTKVKTRENSKFKYGNHIKTSWFFNTRGRDKAVVAIYNHMVVIQVQIGKNIIEDVLLDGGSGVNIITKQFEIEVGGRGFQSLNLHHII